MRSTFRGEWAINLCYEYYENLEAIAPQGTSPQGYTRDEVIVGGFIDAIFHELGHALFDILNIPVFGREEDAADQLSAFLMLQFGKDVARITIRGAAYTYLASKNPRTRTEFADEHGAPAQRFFNYICLAYGGEPDTFREYVDRGVLPKARAEQCPARICAGAPRVREDHPAAYRRGTDEEGPVGPVAAADRRTEVASTRARS